MAIEACRRATVELKKNSPEPSARRGYLVQNCRGTQVIVAVMEKAEEIQREQGNGDNGKRYAKSDENDL